MKASSEVMERIGVLSDTADNFHSMAKNKGIMPETHHECLQQGMADIRDELRAIFKEVAGENPWDHS